MNIKIQSTTASYWFTLRESLPQGMTPSYFTFTLTSDMTGITYSTNLLDLNEGQWSRFDFNPLNLFNLEPGMYSYLITASGSNTTLKEGKALNNEYIVRPSITRPTKITKTIIR